MIVVNIISNCWVFQHFCRADERRFRERPVHCWSV